MDHVAIMKRSWGLIPKILSGEKTIESRWYQTRRAPWGKVKRGERVYFKNSGAPVTARATVAKVLQFEDLTPTNVRGIFRRYIRADGIAKKEEDAFFKRFRNKKYCILVFLKGARKTAPFEVNKKGFGMMAAWITVGDIRKVRL
jgi:hypothetical protein